MSLHTTASFITWNDPDLELEPWEYDTQAPFYWSGNVGPGTEDNPYFVTHGDFPRYERHRTSTLSLKSQAGTSPGARAPPVTKAG